jgi:hypothetical protein
MKFLLIILTFGLLSVSILSAGTSLTVEPSHTRVGFAKVTLSIQNATVSGNGIMEGDAIIEVPLTGKRIAGRLKVQFPAVSPGTSRALSGVFTDAEGKEHPFAFTIKQTLASRGVALIRLKHEKREIDFSSKFSLAGM